MILKNLKKNRAHRGQKKWKHLFGVARVRVIGSHKPEKKFGSVTLRAAETPYSVIEGPMYRKRHRHLQEVEENL